MIYLIRFICFKQLIHLRSDSYSVLQVKSIAYMINFKRLPPIDLRYVAMVNGPPNFQSVEAMVDSEILDVVIRRCAAHAFCFTKMQVMNLSMKSILSTDWTTWVGSQ